MLCICGHTIEEHGGDPDYPGSDACSFDDCGCLGFEEDDED